MNKLPTYQTTHPLFRTHRSEMGAELLELKDNIEKFPQLSKKQKHEIFIKLLIQGNPEFDWPNPLRQEGFWCQKEEKNLILKNYAYPVENEIKSLDLDVFLEKLKKVEEKAYKSSYMGFSTCRICGKRNGTQTFSTSVFAWPCGYRHYIEEHKVLPSAAFVLHIRGLV